MFNVSFHEYLRENINMKAEGRKWLIREEKMEPTNGVGERGRRKYGENKLLSI